MLIHHLATAADWAEAARAGEYRVSTLGRSLDEVGFIHAAYREQVPDVYAEFYARVEEPLVLLHIDPARLRSEVREDRVGDRVFPHIYGPINRQAVIQVQPLDIGGRPITFTRVMLREMAWRMAAGVAFMVLVTAGVLLGDLASPGWVTALGGLLGTVAGILVWRWLARRAQ